MRPAAAILLVAAVCAWPDLWPAPWPPPPEPARAPGRTQPAPPTPPADPPAATPPKAMAAEDYATAWAAHKATGRPLVVLVVADWCQPCQVAKRDSAAALRRIGHLALVNVDREPRQTSLVAGTPGQAIPLLVVYRKGKPPERITGSSQIAAWAAAQGD